MVDPVESLRIENVVATSEIDQELDLAALADDLERAQYDPDQFAGLVYRSSDPKAAILIFRSGKMVTTGAQNVDDVRIVTEQIHDILRRLGLDVPEDPEFTVQNIVTSGDFGQEFRLNAVAIGLGLEVTEYEPEQFPGLVYRLEDPDVVTLLFGSGKCIITGGTQPADAEAAIDVITSRLEDLHIIE